jgi:hypothetical protein
MLSVVTGLRGGRSALVETGRVARKNSGPISDKPPEHEPLIFWYMARGTSFA